MVDPKLVRELREKTGAPMMNCKKALEEVGTDLEKAIDHLRKQGLQKAEKKAHRAAAEGRVFHYIHHNGKVGVLVELNSETDFVARNEHFQEFGRELCQHVAFHDPRWLKAEDAEGSPELEREKEVIMGQIPADKPEQIREKIMAGKLRAFLEQHCLLEQPFIKDDKKTVEQKVKELIGHIGENIKVNRFVRFQIGT